jgi:hypothetical protein
MPKEIETHDGLSTFDLERVYNAQLSGTTTNKRNIVLSNFKRQMPRDERIYKQDDRWDN